MAVMEQVTGIVDGQIVPVTIKPQLTSASTPWCGFLLETTHGVRQDAWWGWHRTHVVLFTEGSLSFRVRWPKGSQNFVARTDDVCVIPSGFDQTHFSVAGSDFKAIVVELDPARAESLLGCKSPASTRTLAPQIVVKDPHITALLRTMASDVALGCPVGALYGQSLSVALASYLLGRFSVKRPGSRPKRRFSAGEAQRVAAYIDANLDCPLNLVDLASLAQLSPRQFVRIFSNTFGTTPHRYVVNQRVGRAKELISKGRSLVEVADALGFASQSHLSFAFRQSTGTSPGQFRLNCGYCRNKASPANKESVTFR